MWKLLRIHNTELDGLTKSFCSNIIGSVVITTDWVSHAAVLSPNKLRTGLLNKDNAKCSAIEWSSKTVICSFQNTPEQQIHMEAGYVSLSEIDDKADQPCSIFYLYAYADSREAKPTQTLNAGSLKQKSV